MALQRRQLMALGLSCSVALPARADAGADAVAARLRAGRVVIAFRHALAPGTFDPPGFRLGQCSTQRNLNDAGRAQAQRIGAWFRQQGLQPAAVRSSPWCRCVDTATLAFGRADPWSALGSPRAGTEETNAAALAELRRALASAGARPEPGRFDVWVTHMFVLSALVGGSASSGEGLVLRSTGDGRPEVLARLNLA